ncbi:MAG: segregation/condensation protein A, partial [Anaerolineae bacterium]|nr:segregation/condensation protein A [Anaerolineae bacterium]
DDLARAVVEAFNRQTVKVSMDSVVRIPRVTIREKIEHITRTLLRNKNSSFRGLLEDQNNRTEIVVTFLAMLELVKRFLVVAKQDSRFGEIELTTMDDLDAHTEFELEFIE